MSRLAIALVFCCSVFVLSGCGSSPSSGSREVTVAQYVMSIPTAYVEVSPGLVENKQLVNKVLASFKIPAEVKGTFEPNIIVTRSDLPPELNFEQFRTLNTQKLSAGLAGYQPGTKEVISFVCEDRTIQGLLVYFRLQDPWYTASPEVRLAQYQFVDQQKGFIISAAYATEDAQKEFVALVESLTCVNTATEKTAG